MSERSPARARARRAGWRSPAATSASATRRRGRRSRRCATSASSSPPAARWRCSAPPARASRRCCRWSRGWTRRRPAPCCWTARAAGAPGYAGLQRQVGLVFQTPELQLFAASAREDVAFGPRRLGWPEAEVAAAVDEAMELVGLPPERFGGRHPYALSGGEQRRLALAGVLAMRPRLLLLDEPFVSLDPATRRELARILARLREDGVTLVLATHDVDLAWALCDELLVLDAGRVAAAGPWDVGEAGRRAARGQPPARAVPRASSGGASAATRPRRRGPRPRPRRRCVRPADRPVLPRRLRRPPARRARQVRRRDGARRRAVRARLVRRPGRVRRRRRGRLRAERRAGGLVLARVPAAPLAGRRSRSSPRCCSLRARRSTASGSSTSPGQGLEFAAFLSLRLRGAGAHRLGAHADDAAAGAHRRARLAGPAAPPAARADRRARAHGDHRAALHPDAAGGAGPDHARPARPRRRLRQRRAHQAGQGAGAGAHAAVRAELPARRRAGAGHGGALLPARHRAHAAAPAQGRGRRRRAAGGHRRPSSPPGCSCRMPA